MRPPPLPCLDCGTDPVKLNIYHVTISELMPQLSAEFTKQYPNVTFDLKSDSFANATANLPRLLAGDNPPDIARAAQAIDLVKDGLLLNFDPYATAYGWDEWPQAQFEAVRVNGDFKRGDLLDHRVARQPQHRGCVLQQGPRGADRHGLSAEDR